MSFLLPTRRGRERFFDMGYLSPISNCAQFKSTRTNIRGLLCLCFVATTVCSFQIQGQEKPAALNSVDQANSIDEAFVLAQSKFDSRILDILENACFDCHGDSGGEADVDLGKYETVQQIIDGRTEWKAVLNAVRNRIMPPNDASGISNDDRIALESFIESLLFDLDCRSNSSPGTVTIRRLSRFEYQNTIRDLLGVNFKIKNNFPADEVGYGFDNIGDVLSTSPLLLEKYLDAAESISRDAIFDVNQIKPSVNWDGADFEQAENTFDRDGDRVLTTNSFIELTHDVRLGGEYEITVRAWEDPAGPENALMGVGANGVESKQFQINAPRKRPKRYRASLELTPGVNKIQIAFKNDYYDKDFPVPARRDRNLGIRSVILKGPSNLDRDNMPRFAVALSKLVNERKVKLNDTNANNDIRQLISLIASFGYRRMANSQEVDRLCKLYEQSQAERPDVYKSIQLVVQAVLASPKFLFRVEEPVAAGSIRNLTQFELATALSYFLWSSMPDEELIRLAAKNQLNDPLVLKSQITRMLADEKASALVDNFAAQWFQLRILEEIDPDPKLFGEFDDLLRESMITETKLLFNEVIKNDLSMTHLLTSKSSQINHLLAKHYKMPESVLAQFEDDEFRSVDLSLVGRKGLLGQASFLTLTSNPTRTSPVKRGKWVLENLLAQPPPPPLPDVPALDNQDELTGTLRQRMSQHSSDPSCAVCHDQLDPIGFALEKFDAIGRFRETDEGQSIDDSGALPDGSSFKGAAELSRILSTSKREDFLRCSVQKLMIYALGRGLEGYDDCTVKEITDAAMQGNDKFSDIIEAIVLSDAFRKRGSGNANSISESKQ